MATVYEGGGGGGYSSGPDCIRVIISIARLSSSRSLSDKLRERVSSSAILFYMFSAFFEFSAFSVPEAPVLEGLGAGFAFVAVLFALCVLLLLAAAGLGADAAGFGFGSSLTLSEIVLSGQPDNKKWKSEIA